MELSVRWVSAAAVLTGLALVAACSTALSPTEPAPAAPAAATAPTEGAELLGTRPPEWHADHWINSPPVALSDLRGRVVLVRWFMSTDCPLCSATAPSLRALDETYRGRGLSVIGFYHHKDEGPLDPAQVETYVKRYGYRFPVGIDTDWRTLKAWWLDGHQREYTSVSFLLDKRGTVRFIHPGGKYEPGSLAEKQLRAKVEELLAEKTET